MFRRLALLNLLLLGMSTLLAYQIREVWNSPPPNFSILKQKPSSGNGPKGKVPPNPNNSPHKGNNEKDPKKPSPAAGLSPAEAYQVVGQANLFRPDRKEWVPPPPPPPLPAAVVPPRPALPPASSFRLYGTLNMPDGSAVALMEGPSGVAPSNPSPSFGRRFPSTPMPTTGRSEPGRAKRYRINDLIGGYRIVDIRNDRVMMEGDGLKAEVLLRDPSTPKQRPAAPPQLMAPPPYPPPSATAASPQRGSPPPPPPPGSPAFAGQPSLGQPQVSSAGEGPATAPPFQPGTQTPPPGRNRQVIQTPFGPKVIYR